MLLEMDDNPVVDEASVPTWRYPDRPSAGRFEGIAQGSDVSFFVVDAAPGDGPALHRHPYSETFVVQAGQVRFQVGERALDAAAGAVLVVPAGAAHGFLSLGPENLRMVAIHAAPRMETAWVDGDDESV